MAFWCKGKKEYCNEEECNSCKFENGSGGIEFEDDVIDGIIISQWISVKERLPTGEDPVLILVKETEHYGYNKEKRKVYYCQYLAYWDGDEWFTTWCNGCRKISDTAKEPYADDYEVTHWMPLPEPPKEG